MLSHIAHSKINCQIHEELPNQLQKMCGSWYRLTLLNLLKPGILPNILNTDPYFANAKPEFANIQ